MFENALIVEDFSLMCRICLLQHDANNLLSIEGIYLASGDVKLMDVLTKHTTIDENYTSASKICRQCVLKAEEAYNFFEKCNESNAVLMQYEYENNRESENNDFSETENIDASNFRPVTDNQDSEFEIITIKNEDREDVEIKIIFDSSSTDDMVKIEDNSQSGDSNKFTIDHVASLSSNHYLTEKCKFCHMLLDREEFEDHKMSLGHFEESESIECPYCEISIRNITNFKKHLRTHSNRQTRKYVCEICGKIFKWNKNYQDHLKSHEENQEEKVMCPECGLLLSSITSLQIHRGKEHTQQLSLEQTWTCNYCKKHFDQIVGYKKHLKEVHAEKDFHCVICGKDCEDKRTLYYHEQLHLDEYGIECNYCQKKILTEEKLLLHQRIHKYIKKKHVCSICNKGFKQADKLEAHVRVHTGEKPFTCNFCRKAFNHQNNLQHHVRLHTGDTPYKCLFCSKEFSNSHSLRKHMNNHEPEGGEDYAST